MAFMRKCWRKGNVILAKPSDTMQSQPFRIYKITTPIDGKLEVLARHISYQLNFITVSPFTTGGCAGAMNGLKKHASSDCPFSVWTDMESKAAFAVCRYRHPFGTVWVAWKGRCWILLAVNLSGTGIP